MPGSSRDPARIPGVRGGVGGEGVGEIYLMTLEMVSDGFAAQ